MVNCDDCGLTTITVFVVVAVKPWLICDDCGFYNNCFCSSGSKTMVNLW